MVDNALDTADQSSLLPADNERATDRQVGLLVPGSGDDDTDVIIGYSPLSMASIAT
jgi:hypothetical protein